MCFTQANLFLPSSFTIPHGLHEDLLEEPYTIMNMSSFDPAWYYWEEAPGGFSSKWGDLVTSAQVAHKLACWELFPVLHAHNTP
jgi:hypothetical protein